MTPAARAIARAHGDRNHKLAQAWSEIVSRKALEAGWSPERALESAQGIRAFDSMVQSPVAYRKQFCCGLVWAARTSRPNNATHAEVRELLIEKLSLVEKSVLAIADKAGWVTGGGGLSVEDPPITNHDRLLFRDIENRAALATRDFVYADDLP